MLTALRLAAAAMIVFGVANEAPTIWGSKLPPELAPIVQMGAIFCIVYTIFELGDAVRYIQEFYKNRIAKPKETVKPRLTPTKP